MKPQTFPHLIGAVSTAWNTVLDAVMPPRCPISGSSVDKAGQLSPQAWSALHFIDAPYCWRCGVPFAVEYGNNIECPSCVKEMPTYDRARAAVVYDDASHKLVVGFKHADRTELAPALAKWIERISHSMISTRSYLVPVPLHRRRLWGRRYNQSALLAQSVAKFTGALYAPRILARNRPTPPQKNLSASGRKRNMAGAFSVLPTATKTVENAQIVLVDDVLTTGATLSACAKALKRAGAARVDAVVLARVVKGGIGAI